MSSSEACRDAGSLEDIVVDFWYWCIVERRVLSRFGLAYLDKKSLAKSLRWSAVC